MRQTYNSPSDFSFTPRPQRTRQSRAGNGAHVRAGAGAATRQIKRADYRYATPVYRNNSRANQPPVAKIPVIRARKSRRFKTALAAMTIVVAGVWLYRAGFRTRTPAAAIDSTHSVSAVAAPKPAEPELTTAKLNGMQASIKSLIADHPDLEISVSALDLTTGQSQHYGVSAPYVGASVSKLISATLFLHNVETGSANLSDNVGGSPAAAQLQKMIVNSDNDAWQSFNDLMGHPALQAYAASLGFNDYSAADNTITSDDVAALLQKLYLGQLLNPAHTKLLLSYMHNANENQYIPAAVPSGTAVYHKAGYLDDRAHDAAIIDDSQRPFVLVIFTKADSGKYDFPAGIQLFHDITATALSTYQH